MDNKNSLKLFKFNLLPPITKEEIEIVEERDNTVLYSFLLIFFSILIYLVLVMFQGFLIQPRQQELNTQINQLNARISTFDPIKKINGELYIKSLSLDPLLKLDIKVNDVIEQSQQLFNGLSNYQISAYQRESTGLFVITVQVDNLDSIKTIYENSKNVKQISNLNVRSVNFSGTNATIQLSFEFKNAS